MLVKLIHTMYRSHYIESSIKSPANTSTQIFLITLYKFVRLLNLPLSQDRPSGSCQPCMYLLLLLSLFTWIQKIFEFFVFLILFQLFLRFPLLFLLRLPLRLAR